MKHGEMHAKIPFYKRFVSRKWLHLFSFAWMTKYNQILLFCRSTKKNDAIRLIEWWQLWNVFIFSLSILTALLLPFFLKNISFLPVLSFVRKKAIWQSYINIFGKDFCTELIFWLNWHTIIVVFLPNLLSTQ